MSRYNGRYDRHNPAAVADFKRRCEETERGKSRHASRRPDWTRDWTEVAMLICIATVLVSGAVALALEALP